MRRSRGRSRRSGPIASVVLVLLVITVLAVGTGYFLSGFLISSFAGRGSAKEPPGSTAVQPNPGNTAQPSPGTNPSTTDPSATVPAATNKVTPTLPIVFYGQVQMGAFAQESNASALANALVAQGFPASVIKRDLHRVVVGVFAERSLADDYKKSLEAKGNKDILLTSTEIRLTSAKSYQGSEADLVKSLSALVTDAAEIVTKLLQVSDQLYSKSVDQATWKKTIGTLAEGVARLEQAQLPAVQSPLIGEWTRLLTDLKSHLANQGGRTVGDRVAWGSSQAELVRILNGLQTIYGAMSM